MLLIFHESWCRRTVLFQIFQKKKNLKSDNGQRENYYLVLKCGSQVSPSNDILTGTIIKVDVKIKETIFFEIFCFRKFHVTPCHTHQKFGNRRLVNCPQIFIMAFFFPFINHADSTNVINILYLLE